MSAPANADQSNTSKANIPKLQIVRKDSFTEGTPSTRMGWYGSTSNEAKEIMQEQAVYGRYDYEKLATIKVFGVVKKTVLEEGTLWKETGVWAMLFWAVFGYVYWKRPEGFSGILGSEAGIRAFLMMFSTLIGLLLSFYTALSLGRWWQMRLGVQQIGDAAKKLTMMLSQGVTDDEVLLGTIHRYARASLFLIFCASQHEEGAEPPLDRAFARGLLHEEEADKLKKLNPNMTFVQAETLWVWLANAVSRLNAQGLTKGPPHYCLLMGAVEQGRAGVTNIQTHLDTPIPFGYVHLLCLMVKLHNFLVTILLALTSVMLSGGAEGFRPVGVFRTAFRAFFMPFLYNSILILNSDVTDPFGADAGDFDFQAYDVNIAMSAQSSTHAKDHLPDWIANAQFKPPASQV